MISVMRAFLRKCNNYVYRYSSLIIPLTLLIVFAPFIVVLMVGINNALSPILGESVILTSIITGIITSLIATYIYSLTLKVKQDNIYKSCYNLYGDKLVNQYLNDLESYNGQVINDQCYKFTIERIESTNKYLKLNCEVTYRKRLSYPLLKFKFLRKTCAHSFEKEIEQLSNQYKASNFEFLYINDECDFSDDDPFLKKYQSEFEPQKLFETLSVKNTEDVSVINTDNIRYISSKYEDIEFELSVIGRMYKPSELYKISYSYSFIIESDSYIYIPLELPTYNFSFSFDYHQIADTHDVSGKTLMDSHSGFEPNLRGNSKHIISDDCNKYIFPKGGVVINWWVKERDGVGG